MTIRSIILGFLLSIILGAANAYLGLFAGMTVSASIPAAVLSMGILSIFKNSTIKENLSIITPLGVNLKKNLKINFDKKTKYSQSFNKCEDYGCLVIFEKRLGMEYSLTNSNTMEISFHINGVQEPVVLKLPIVGFDQALKDITKELDKY